MNCITIQHVINNLTLFIQNLIILFAKLSVKTKIEKNKTISVLMACQKLRLPSFIFKLQIKKFVVSYYYDFCYIFWSF